ncbi:MULTISPECIES: ABC transporter substrate-binding protein [unclassified Butyrivibrio]|uniref:ABC transporter substrate-binding protein n=1 Tax=unclassified Butyrivibrio TaxID=2639466 RepID=UPI0004223C1C|nr:MULTISPECIES: ABC transporter substrate-binding protein [unclassified Butyrivibrio]
MKKLGKFLALGLAGTMVVSAVGCGSNSGSSNETAGSADQTESTEAQAEDSAEAAESTESTEEATEETESSDSAEAAESTGSGAPLVIGESEFSEKFSPFFANSAYDINVEQMTSIPLLKVDRMGEIIMNGIEGETKEYDGNSYEYKGPANCEITENEDGTVDYAFELRDDLKFSDGEPITIDDVIFSMYVLADPSYDGPSSFSALPITGMEAYKSGSDTLFNLLVKAGEDNTDFTYFTEDQQKKFWETDFPAAKEQFINDIADYCSANGAVSDDEDIAKDPIANAMANWGYGKAEGGVLTAPSGATFDVKGGTAPTVDDFWNEIMAAYDNDVMAATDKEKAGDGILDMLSDDYKNSIETGDSAASITGIEKTGDYSLVVHMDKLDATAIYSLPVEIAPLHYYGDKAEYDYDNNKFGFSKGDLSSVRAKTTTPLGAGPYVFDKYENKIVYFKANENYYLGAPVIKEVQMKVTQQSDAEPAVVQGTIDVAEPSANKSTLEQIAGDNSNGELTGDKIATSLVDNNGYGYIGMNSENVKVGSDPSSDESKALRKAIATVIAVHRDVVIDSYYGDAANVINYPISNTSWAAPQPSDPDYKVAFSVDADGNDIYTDGMSEDEKYDAALQAALGFFEKAGYTVSDGKLTAAPEGAKLSYEAMIPADGKGDHPSFGILTAAKEDLAKIGFDLIINDLSDSSVLWSATEGGTAEIWCAAWGSSIDPDMYQIYHSEGGSAYMYRINQKELDDLVVEARSTTDQSVRKAIYKECLDYIVDYAVEIPIYQRQQCSIYSVDRIDVDNSEMLQDQTTYFHFFASTSAHDGIEKLMTK